MKHLAFYNIMYPAHHASFTSIQRSMFICNINIMKFHCCRKGIPRWQVDIFVFATGQIRELHMNFTDVALRIRILRQCELFPQSSMFSGFSWGGGSTENLTASHWSRGRRKTRQPIVVVTFLVQQNLICWILHKHNWNDLFFHRALKFKHSSGAFHVMKESFGSYNLHKRPSFSLTIFQQNEVNCRFYQNCYIEVQLHMITLSELSDMANTVCSQTTPKHTVAECTICKP